MSGLEERAIAERGALHRLAVELRAVLRTQVLRHPSVEHPFQPQVVGRHAPVGNADAQLAAVAFLPQRLGPTDENRAHTGEIEPGTAPQGLVALQDEKEMRRPETRAAPPGPGPGNGPRLHVRSLPEEIAFR